MSNFGEGFLASAFLFCSFAAGLGLVALKLKNGAARKVFFWARRAQLAAAGLSVVALILLIAAFLRNDFSIDVVGRYSSSELPFFYKLSAVWAGPAGSLVLWSVAVLVLFTLWLVRSQTGELPFNAAALSIGAGLCGGFLALCVFVAKPFASCSAVIDEGMGLNPVLQNFWMIIHPPLLFVGYSAFSIPFVIASAGALAGRTEDSAFYRQLRHWLLFGVCFLGMGIAAGARWSYIELGWGGYWSWDPVENASLLPWLVAVAALHSLAGISLADKFRFWTIILAPVPFILCLFATFITRSGILQSVHSFGQNVMFSALLAFISCCLLLWIACIIRAAKVISIVGPSQMNGFRLKKSHVLFWINVVLVFTAVVIGTATFWPLIWRAITSSPLDFTLTRQFYDRVISVVGILLAFLVGLGALADLQKRSGFILQLLGCCGVGLVCFGIVFRFGGKQLLISLACGVCAFSLVSVLRRLWLNLKTRGKIGGDVAYLGLLLLVVVAGPSSTERAIQILLTKGERITLGEYEFVYDSFEHKSFAGVTKVGPEIIVRKKGLTKKLWPHNNLYPGGQSIAEVAVHTGLLEDIYISLDDIARDGRVQITAKVKPLMFWVWFAALLIVAGPALAMLEGRSKK